MSKEFETAELTSEYWRAKSDLQALDHGMKVEWYDEKLLSPSFSNSKEIEAKLNILLRFAILDHAHKNDVNKKDVF